MGLTPANGTSVSKFDLSSRKPEDGIALTGLVEICDDMIDSTPEYGQNHTLEMEKGYVPSAPKMF